MAVRALWKYGLGFLLLLTVGLTLMAMFSRPPAGLGVDKGRLSPCPDRPNCVSSHSETPEHAIAPVAFRGSVKQVMADLQAVVEAWPRATLVSADQHYLHAEFRSRMFRFVDDVEFLVDIENQVVHFRSASRVGYSDFGVNRRRMEAVRQALHVRSPTTFPISESLEP